MRLLILLCLLIPTQAFSETSLWRVSNGKSELFLGGTIHVLSNSDYPLPKEFDQAYSQAQMLVLETDLDSVTPSQLFKNLMYGKGDSLEKHLKPETYQAVVHYFEDSKIPEFLFSHFKPSLVMITLMANELQKLDLLETGVDHFFQKKSKVDKKEFGQLESVEKQLDVLEKMGEGHEDEMILSTIDEIEDLPTTMGDMKAAWRNGDLAEIEELHIQPMRDDYPELYQMLLVERNVSWMPQIEKYLATPKTELILVGVAHLAGEDGLLAQLRQRGYQVKAF